MTSSIQNSLASLLAVSSLRYIGPLALQSVRVDHKHSGRSPWICWVFPPSNERLELDKDRRLFNVGYRKGGVDSTPP